MFRYKNVFFFDLSHALSTENGRFAMAIILSRMCSNSMTVGVVEGRASVEISQLIHMTSLSKSSRPSATRRSFVSSSDSLSSSMSSLSQTSSFEELGVGVFPL